MCQAYEGERAFVVAQETRARLREYEAMGRKHGKENHPLSVPWDSTQYGPYMDSNIAYLEGYLDEYKKIREKNLD